MGLVSIVIPARDAGRTLEPCLAALASQGVPGPDSELVVVDDASTDDTPDVAARYGAQVVRGAGRGPAAARNLGALATRGDILVFLDADTVPLEGWLREMTEPFHDPGVVAVKGRYYTRQPGLVARFVQLEFEDKYARLERAARVDFIDTGTAAYRRSAFMDSTGFDESFLVPSAEDVELGYRLAASGARIVFNPRAAVMHSHADRLSQYLLKKARYGYHRVSVYRRFPDKAMGDSYTPPTMGVQIGLAAVSGLLAGAAVLRVRGAGALLQGVLLLYGATTLPLVARAGLGRPLLAVVVPGLSYLRSWAQGLGLLAGLLAQLRR